nr:integrase domain-containing protein [Paraburkholderia megapolitana]
MKSLSALTQERRTGALCKAFVELRRGGFEIQSPWSLKEKHVRWLVQHWVSLGQGGGTIENKLTYLRALASWIGKKDLVGTLADYVDRKEKGLVRSYVAIEDKSWIGHGITAAQKIEEIGQTCPYVAVQLKLQAAFGLRVLESFMLRPLEAARNPQTLGIDRGTKGGRPREVPIQERINVLEEAARLSNGVTGSTVPADRTLKQWRDWYYYVLEKHGVTKSGLGFTSHGLRHQWAHELYETVTGTPAPIKRSDLVPDAALHEEAQRRVAEAMGHSRITKANAYLSTLKIQQRLTRPPRPRATTLPRRSIELPATRHTQRPRLEFHGLRCTASSHAEEAHPRDMAPGSTGVVPALDRPMGNRVAGKIHASSEMSGESVNCSRYRALCGVTFGHDKVSPMFQAAPGMESLQAGPVLNAARTASASSARPGDRPIAGERQPTVVQSSEQDALRDIFGQTVVAQGIQQHQTQGVGHIEFPCPGEPVAAR